MKCCGSCEFFEKYSDQRSAYYKGDGQCNLHKDMPKIIKNSYSVINKCSFYEYRDYVAEKIKIKSW